MIFADDRVFLHPPLHPAGPDELSAFMETAFEIATQPEHCDRRKRHLGAYCNRPGERLAVTVAVTSNEEAPSAVDPRLPIAIMSRSAALQFMPLYCHRSAC